jgi:alkylation response protein AidB-like acyl-CoA dehydrogenase
MTPMMIGESGLNTDVKDYRSRLRSWLESNPPPKAGNIGSEASKEVLAWHGRLADAGLACPHWPERYGGRSSSLDHQLVLLEELALRGLSLRPIMVGLFMVGPLLMALDDDQLADRYIPDIIAGRTHWCQLFSEPDAGSDLAAIRTTALRDGDSYIVNGQKVWSSYAHVADFGLLLARTNLTSESHAGISLLVIDMKSAGIEVRPIRQLTGGSEFNEVFFNHVVVPSSSVIGRADRGWSLVINTLSKERFSLALTGYVTQLPLLLDELEALRGHSDSTLRQTAAHVFTSVALQRLSAMRVAAAPNSDENASMSIASLMKLQSTQSAKLLANLRVQRIGTKASAAGVDGGAEFQFAVAELLYSLAVSIGGGTTEVQKNAIAERILGMPRG